MSSPGAAGGVEERNLNDRADGRVVVLEIPREVLRVVRELLEQAVFRPEGDQRTIVLLFVAPGLVKLRPGILVGSFHARTVLRDLRVGIGIKRRHCGNACADGGQPIARQTGQMRQLLAHLVGVILQMDPFFIDLRCREFSLKFAHARIDAGLHAILFERNERIGVGLLLVEGGDLLDIVIQLDVVQRDVEGDLLLLILEILARGVVG